MSDLDGFIVLAKPRSGSTWVIDILNRHPDLEAFDEVFHPSATRCNAGFGSQRIPFFDGSDYRTRSIRPISTWLYLRRLFEPDRAVGFKLIYGQARRNPDVLLYAIVQRLKIIHLVRENQLDALISLEIVKATQRWHLTESADKNLPIPRIQLDTDCLIATLKSEYDRIDRIRALLRHFRMPRLEVAYENLKADAGAYGEIWRFLGTSAPPGELESTFRIVRTQSYEEILDNWAEVRECLKASPYRNLLRAAQSNS